MKWLKTLVFVCALFVAAPAAAQDADCDAGFRLFDHEYLAGDPVCIPDDPQQIVVLNTVAFNTLLDIGVTPVGALGGLMTNYGEIRPDFTSTLNAIADVGSYSAPNLEAMLELNPDLILADTVLSETLGALETVAPIIIIGDFGSNADWQEYALFFADAVNQADAAQVLIDDYEARIAQFRDLNITDDTVSIVRVLPENIRLYLPLSFAGAIIQDAGLTFPEAQAAFADEPRGLVGIGLEEVDLADAATIFLFSSGGNAAPEELQALQENPVWHSLDAVQGERVFVVGGSWISLGLFSAHAILDDLFQYVAQIDPADVAPNPFLTTTGE